MHDPRAFNSWAVSYPTVARGGCHIAAPTYWLERGVTFPDLGFPDPLDRFDPEQKGLWTAVFQNFCEVLESMVTCKLSLYGGIRSQHCVDLICLGTGWDMDLAEIMQIGERAINVKRLINLKLGFNRADDRLPARIRSLTFDRGGHRRLFTGARCGPHAGRLLSSQGLDPGGRSDPRKTGGARLGRQIEARRSEP